MFHPESRTPASRRAANILVIILTGLCLLTGTACDDFRQSSTSPQLSGKDLFRLHCSPCHGDGTGNGHIAGTLKVLPRNLKHKEWQASVTDDEILAVIRDGGPARKLSPDMPPFKEKLSDAQMQVLVRYLRYIGH